jgi:hypothetical protein
MDDTVVALSVALIGLLGYLVYTQTPACKQQRLRVQPPPPPIGQDTESMGVQGRLLHALNGVLEPLDQRDPRCMKRPFVTETPAHCDVKEILNVLCRKASLDTPYEFHRGTVLAKALQIDDLGVETYMITCLIHEKSSLTTLRLAVKAQRHGVNDTFHIRSLAYDPMVPRTGLHIVGEDLAGRPGEVDTSVYVI